MKKNLVYLFTMLCSLSFFTACNEDDSDEKLSSEAQIMAFTFDSKLVAYQPVIEGDKITFMVVDTAKTSDLAELLPSLTVSAGATVTPASGVKQDFSKPVVYTVVSQNGATTTKYEVSIAGKVTSYDFEEWMPGVEGTEPENTFYKPVGKWDSSNTGAHLIKAMFGQTDPDLAKIPYVLTETSDAQKGEKGVKIVTIDTKGLPSLLPGVFPCVPKVTSGSLFLGAFIADIQNTLKSTKFGILTSLKPVTIKGYYKFTPGAEYFHCEDPANNSNVAVLDPNKKDECSIAAILYSVDTEKDDQILDGTNIYTSEKIVAIAQLEDGSEKTDYTPFELKMNYIKPYDPTKLYRFAIICSSSKNGDKFSGAPNSTLIVDNIEVISE